MRVLEPSPPAILDDAFFADDPAVGGIADVLPVSGAGQSWAETAAADEASANYARDHWLGPYHQLGAVPANYVAERNDFHRIAFGVVSNARKAANGKFGLRYTYAGFGTPFFGNDEQVRVEGNELVRQIGPGTERTAITTLAAAAAFFGTVANADQAEHDTIELGDLDRPLVTTVATGAFLGHWFGFGTAALEQTRLLGDEGDDVGRIQLWPGHFDPAVEIGNADEGRRATYGVSPGDQGSDEPYLYVGAWGDVDRSNSYWNETTFNGASMGYAELLASRDARQAALDFFAAGYASLHS